MTQASNSNEANALPDRWTLTRDILVLQLKLIVDGLRDFILVPISLTVGTLSLLRGGDAKDSDFYRLLRLGRRSERWINLFGAVDRVYGPATGNESFSAEDIDEMVERVESFVIDEYRKGGVTRQAKDRLDRALGSLHKLASRSNKSDADGA